MRDTAIEEMENGVDEVHIKAIKREAENGVKPENGEPAAKIKRESKYIEHKFGHFLSTPLAYDIHCTPGR